MGTRIRVISDGSKKYSGGIISAGMGRPRPTLVAKGTECFPKDVEHWERCFWLGMILSIAIESSRIPGFANQVG